MNLHKIKARAKVAAILIATTGSLVGGNLASASRTAGADPAAASAYNGVGSDTIQDLFDAYSGAEPFPPSPATVYSIPMHSSAASGNKTINSWDAVPAGGTAAAPGCIITKYGGNSFDRPNGSSNGIAAIRAAATVPPTTFANSAATCAGPQPVTGQVDFARSSRGPNAGTSPCATPPDCLSWVPFARDAVSFAFYDHSTNNIATLTTTKLHDLYSSGTGTLCASGVAPPCAAGDDLIKACLTQSGSGTTKFWEGAIGVADAVAVNAATMSGCYGTVGIEENGANAFFTFASAQPLGTDSVVDFSAGSWISQANGVALDRSGTARAGGVDMGAIDALGKPYIGTAPNEAPNPVFYASPLYGRDVYVVVSTRKFAAITGDAGLKSLFLGGTAQICTAGALATALKFGFSSPPSVACGTQITANLAGS